MRLQPRLSARPAPAFRSSMLLPWLLQWLRWWRQKIQLPGFPSLLRWPPGRWQRLLRPREQLPPVLPPPEFELRAFPLPLQRPE